jgi:hypothetical protein
MVADCQGLLTSIVKGKTLFELFDQQNACSLSEQENSLFKQQLFTSKTSLF